MPKLNEYLGGLVSEITTARKLADLQTVEIAQEYAKNDLLKHFSIPRMRIGNVDLTIPIANAGSSVKMKFHEFTYDEITKVAGNDYNASDVENDRYFKNFLLDMEKSYDDQLKSYDQYSSGNVEYYDELLNSLASGFAKKLLEFCISLKNFYWKDTEKEVFIMRVHDRIFTESKNTAGESTGGNQEVIVEASQLMELDPKCITYIKMTVTETGMEWSRYEDINGNIVETLMPE